MSRTRTVVAIAAPVLLVGGLIASTSTITRADDNDDAAQAREDLFARVEGLLREDAARFDALLDEAAPEAESFARLHGAVDAIRRAA